MFFKSVVLLFVSCLSLATQDNDEIRRTAAGLVQVTKAWSDGTLSSPGVRVEVREVAREHDGSRLKVQYHVWFKGVPADYLYTAFTWPVNARKPSPMIQGITLSQEGLVMCAGRTSEQCGSADRPDDPVEFTFFPEKGEVFRLALASADGKVKGHFAVVPDPIMTIDHGCTFEAVRLLPKFELAMLRGRGLMPNEPLRLLTKSYSEEHEMQLKAGPDGEFVFGLLPAVAGKSAGTADVQLKASKCAPALAFDWGR